MHFFSLHAGKLLFFLIGAGESMELQNQFGLALNYKK